VLGEKPLGRSQDALARDFGGSRHLRLAIALFQTIV
jgi:hypothetical protein